MPVLFLSGEPRVGQSVSGVGNKECTSADNFNTIIKPMKSLPTFYYNYMEIYVNNFMIKYSSLLGDTAFSLWCTTVFPLSETGNTFCYSLILNFLPYPFQELMPARKYSEKKRNLFYPSSRVQMKYYFTTLWYFLPFSLITTSSPWCSFLSTTPGFNHFKKGEVCKGVSHLSLPLWRWPSGSPQCDSNLERFLFNSRHLISLYLEHLL